MIEKLKRINLFTKTLAQVKKKDKFFSLLTNCLADLTDSQVAVFYQREEDIRGNERLVFKSYQDRKQGIHSLRMEDGEDFAEISMNSDGGRINVKNPLVYALHYNKIAYCSTEESSEVEGRFNIRPNDHDWSFFYFFKDRYGTPFDNILIVPLVNYKNEKVGCLVLSADKYSHTEEDHQLIIFFSQLAVSILTNHILNLDLKKLFESFVSVLAKAIDDKSPYTGAHCRRVPAITMLIADTLNAVKTGHFKDYALSPEKRYELELAALLHDCGKVTTPVHIMDKSTKLETIFDRIHLLDERVEIIKRDFEIESLRGQIHLLEDKKMNKKDRLERIDSLGKKLMYQLEHLEKDFQFLKKINFGQEKVAETDIHHVREISRRYGWVDRYEVTRDFLTDNELKNLEIKKGTLLPEERDLINHHIDVTIEMLESIHFPAHLKRIPELAGGHHEKMDGSGYPKQLTRFEMSLEARIMGLADIFEALTAVDRPYKKGKTLSETMHIMGLMMQGKFIDEDLFHAFVDEKIYLAYAKEYLNDYQIDEVVHSKIPGYIPPEERILQERRKKKRFNFWQVKKAA